MLNRLYKYVENNGKVEYDEYFQETITICDVNRMFYDEELLTIFIKGNTLYMSTEMNGFLFTEVEITENLAEDIWELLHS